MLHCFCSLCQCQRTTDSFSHHLSEREFQSAGFKIPVITGASTTSRMRISPKKADAIDPYCKKGDLTFGKQPMCLKLTSGSGVQTFREATLRFNRRNQNFPCRLTALYHGHLKACRQSAPYLLTSLWPFAIWGFWIDMFLYDCFPSSMQRPCGNSKRLCDLGHWNAKKTGMSYLVDG